MHTLAVFAVSLSQFKLMLVLFSALIFFVTALIIILYVLRAVAYFKMAKSIGISNTWHGFVPFLSSVIAGKLTGFYRPKAGARFKSAPGVLLALDIIRACAFAVFMVLFISSVASLLFAADAAVKADTSLSADAFDALKSAGNAFFVFIGSCAVYKTVYIICLFRIYSAFASKNVVIMLIVSVVFGFSIPLFLFAIRNNIPARSYRQRNAENASNFNFGGL